MIGMGSLGSLVVRIGADLKGLNLGLAQASGKIDVFAKRVGVTTAGVSKILLGFGVATGVAAGFAIKAAIDFESAFTGVRKTVDATEKEFKELRQELLNLSREIPVAATDLAKIQEIAGQLGVKGVKNLTNFTQVIAEMAVTTNLTKEAAAIQFARIASIINEPIANIRKMGSAVVELGNTFEVNEAEILSFTKRLAAAGKLAKLTTGDIFGVAAAFASVGIRAEAGGTAVSNVLLEMQKEGKTGREALINFLKTLSDSGDQAAIKLEELGFKEKRTRLAFLSLAGAGDKLRKVLEVSNDAIEKGTALGKEAALRFGTTASAITLMKNEITFLQVEIGTKLLPVFKDLLKITKMYVNYATGADLKVARLTLLKIAYKDIIEQIKETRELAEAGGVFAEELAASVIEMERRKLVLAQMIADEKQRALETDQQALVDTDIVDTEEDPRVEQIRTAAAEIKAEEEALKQKQTELTQAGAEERKAILDKALSATRTAFTNTLSDLISGAKTAKEAFSALGKAMIKIVADFIAEQIIAATIGRALQMAATAAAVTQMVIIAQAAAPAAALVSLATAGGNAPPAAAGMASVAGMAKAIAATAEVGLQEGTDKIPARLTPGEMVIPSTFAEAIREGRLVLSGPEGMDTPVGVGGERSIVFENIEINVAGDLDEEALPDIIEQIGIQTENESRGA